MNPDEVQVALESIAERLMEEGRGDTIPEELLAIAEWVEHEFVEVEE